MSLPCLVLHHAAPPIVIPRERVYFAFEDGRFDYDCRSLRRRSVAAASAITFRLDRTLATQLTSRPALRVFIEPLTGGSTLVGETFLLPAIS